jgi:hypothetical protein
MPALNQYWHPWLLGGSAHGRVVVGEDSWDLDGWQVYGEKNWGKGGFPEASWWGQAQGFSDPTAYVAFAGGDVSAGPLRTRVTDESWVLQGRIAQWQIDVEGSGSLETAHVLPVPLPDEHRNVAGAIEHLGARLRVSVRRRRRLVWEDESSLAALEHGGIERARAEVVRRGGRADDVEAPPTR